MQNLTIFKKKMNNKLHKQLNFNKKQMIILPKIKKLKQNQFNNQMKKKKKQIKSKDKNNKKNK